MSVIMVSLAPKTTIIGSIQTLAASFLITNLGHYLKQAPRQPDSLGLLPDNGWDHYFHVIKQMQPDRCFITMEQILGDRSTIGTKTK